MFIYLHNQNAHTPYQPSRLAEECGARLMGVAEEGILEELRARIMEGKGKVSMPQVSELDRVID